MACLYELMRLPNHTVWAAVFWGLTDYICYPVSKWMVPLMKTGMARGASPSHQEALYMQRCCEQLPRRVERRPPS